jgi:antitoxin (DNA-binding transcriptional repressor) of toxin-antitoxin stability system
MGEVPISEATGHLDEVANESAATGEVIYLTRDGRRPAAIVPVEVDAGIEAAEDAAGIAAAQAAMAEPGEDIPAEGVWAELGIADDQIGHRSEVYNR